MVDPADLRVVLMDSQTAATLAQVLPLLLLTLMVELRRVEVHRRGHSIRTTRVLLGLFFIAFGVVETVFVLSIDGALIPFTWSDLISALSIFALLALLFVLSLLDSPSRRKHDEA
ncbi:hypothetical protein [Leifsonia sp. 21MFCrub1.1]|uniref:hypothetical protein n=1 Tax=Leifsonia sp. 21MFCrub1.1 TaxID=1798223 RepID=UPI0008929FC8|nr:hypothetical protein [Leifsonia sp. 21MFCrub1.1]SEA41823.1 hypothetical protein SAMN04515680_0291 [Leifsonia sp. 21MFCrub1.1]